ncbi:MAG: hypothetical protein ACUVTL_01565 [Thermoproteota archaeon]
MVRCVVRPYVEGYFDDYAETLLRTWPCEHVHEARNEVALALKQAGEDLGFRGRR